MPESPTYMTAKEASTLAENLLLFGGKQSLVTRIALMESQCRQAGRLIQAMPRQVHSGDMWQLPPEE
jgi:hypothetical protein